MKERGRIMSLRDTQQPKVGKEQGGERFFCKEAGYMNFNDQDFTGAKMRLMLLSLNTRTTQTLSTNSKLAVSVLTAKYGYAPILQTTAASTAAANLPSAEVGARLHLDFRAWQSDMSILPGNASLAFGHTLSDLSCIMIVNGSANSAWVQLDCFVDGRWTITNQSNRTGVSGQVSS
jgi:hypothetical protein